MRGSPARRAVAAEARRGQERGPGVLSEGIHEADQGGRRRGLIVSGGEISESGQGQGDKPPVTDLRPDLERFVKCFGGSAIVSLATGDLRQPAERGGDPRGVPNVSENGERLFGMLRGESGMAQSQGDSAEQGEGPGLFRFGVQGAPSLTGLDQIRLGLFPVILNLGDHPQHV